MKNVKLCLGTEGYSGDVATDIAMFHQAGFEGFFTCWEKGEDLNAYRKLAKELGMTYQSVHAPYVNSKYMWQSGENAKAAVDELLQCLEATARADVNVMVAHAFIGFNDHSPNEIGLENFRKVLARAQSLGITLALENTEGEEYLQALLQNLDSPNLGFCWDSGHEMCYNRSRDLLKDYGHLLVATHLNDNLGISDFNGQITWTDDLHLLPFDGIANWQNIAHRLNVCQFDGPLTFELNRTSKPNRHDNDKYIAMPLEQYLAEAYARACKVATLVLAEK